MDTMGVNSGVDKLLRVVVFSGYKGRARDFHRICVLQMGTHCEVLRTLADWAKSRPKEYKQIVNKLKRIAENKDLPIGRTIKRVGSQHRIVQISTENARLYCFYDKGYDSTVICVHSLQVNKGTKETMQNKAILKANRLRERWQSALPVRGKPDVRVG
jgi:hypothetical protein